MELMTNARSATPDYLQGFVGGQPVLVTPGAFLPVYQGPWAQRPSANRVAAGTQIVVTDVGPGTAANRRSWWWSDGTYWRPVHGKQFIDVQVGSVAAPVATLTGNGTTQQFVLPRELVLPGGMLFPGCQVEIIVALHKSGVHTGTFLASIDPLQVAANVSLTDVRNTSCNAANPSTNRINQVCGVYNGGWLEYQTASMSGDGSTSGAVIDHPDAGCNTDPRYVLFSIGSTYSDSAANLVQYSVAVIG